MLLFINLNGVLIILSVITIMNMTRMKIMEESVLSFNLTLHSSMIGPKHY